MLKSALIYSAIVLLVCSIYVMSSPISPQKRTCGSDLNDRVSRICLPRGGYQRHSNHSRSKRSIVKECCWNVCPDSNIFYYCSNQNVLVDSSLPANDAVRSTTVYYHTEQQNDGSVEDLVTERSIMSTNLNFFKSRQYGTISPEFRKEAIYVG